MTAHSDYPLAPLTYLADVRPSGVDKHTHPGEAAVRLCNYTDIYYRERITQDLAFMEASATQAEIDRFTLLPGDVVMTKDSETADDIGIPAIVAEPLDGVLLGYHNTLLRPSADLEARYLFWFLNSAVAAAYWETKARGVTRVGLRTEDVAALPVPLPPLDTQRRIADMLDAETARIDTLIEKNERVIELAWRRYRVMRLNLLAGGYQLGSAQASEWATSKGWPVAPLWLVSMNHDSGRIPLNAEERGSRQGPYPYWGANSIQDHIDDWLFDGPRVLIGEDGAPFFIDDRDVAWVAEGRYWVNNHAHVLEAVSVDTWWLAECLNVVDYSLFVTGSTRDKLTQDGLNRIPVPTPPREEQAEILRELDRARELASALVDRCRRQQELLRLRRQALITAAVTGQIGV